MPLQPTSDTPESILNFWFGPIHQGFSEKAYSDQWFSGGKPFDTTLCNLFQPLVEKALKTQISWEKTPENVLAMILLLDQFPRNIYRKKTQAFAGDTQALTLTKQGINEKLDASLAFIKRLFFYMPLMHSEHIEDQIICIAQLKTLLNEVPLAKKPFIANSLKFAEQHHDIIIKYGRFPYRNAVLGRKNTPEEVQFLQQGINFGQG